MESKGRTLFNSSFNQCVFPDLILNLSPSPYLLSKLLKLFKALVVTSRYGNTSTMCRMVVKIKWDNAHQAPVAVSGTDEEFHTWQLLLSYCEDCSVTSLMWFHHGSSLMDTLQPALVKKQWRTIALHSGLFALENALMADRQALLADAWFLVWDYR